MKLFRVTFKVQPTADHPLYWDWEFGLLSMWLFGASADDAAERAEAIIKHLPYELVGDGCKSRLADAAPPYSKAETTSGAANQALQSGLAIFVEAGSTGIDEPEGFRD